MTFKAELACSQCAAPVELDESDHFFTCEYCGVQSFVASPFYHFILPARHSGESLLLAPYLRFKGVLYCCDETQIRYRIADVTHRGLPIKTLPLSLGVRPQAVRMKFSDPSQGVFLKNKAPLKAALEKTTSILTAEAGEVRHLCSIGKTVSLIYLPIALRGGKAYDALGGDELGKLPADKDIFGPVYDHNYAWQPQILGAICPNCGWNLKGESSSLVLICHQCDTAWEAGKSGFEQVAVQQFGAWHKDDLALPFWRMEVRMSGVSIHSYADFLRLTNQPRVIRPEWERQPNIFWTPAFKIRPKIYLHLARQLSVVQPHSEELTRMPTCHSPVTMPAKEAEESLKVVLAEAACRKKDILALLPQIRMKATNLQLVYLPFRSAGSDYVQKELNLSINGKTLEYGASL